MGSRARRGSCALPRPAGPILEALEPRRLLDATGLLDVAESLALDGSTDISIPPIYTSVQDSDVQAAPVVEATALVTALSLDQTFLLHSNPGATKVIYLDFDGHTTTGTSWNVSYGDPIITPAFNFEGDTSSFTDNELSRIQYIWQRVAEDYLPFNVDVTTEDPGVDALTKSNSADAYYGVRVCIGGDSSWYGTAVGGVAKLNSFNYSSDTPCFIFPANLGNGSEKYTAEAISHEVGHTLGLSHDGTTTGTEYYQGQGSWAPIMGVGYYKTITQWSKGEYANANNTQDDLAIIAGSVGNFGYRADDHGSDIASADAMTTVSTSVSADGIIERTNDVDFFSFTTGTGTVSFTISPAARGPNLDILANLYDSAGQVVSVSNPIGALNASFSLSLDAGIVLPVHRRNGRGRPADDRLQRLRQPGLLLHQRHDRRSRPDRRGDGRRDGRRGRGGRARYRHVPIHAYRLDRRRGGGVLHGFRLGRRRRGLPADRQFGGDPGRGVVRRRRHHADRRHRPRRARNGRADG